MTRDYPTRPIVGVLAMVQRGQKFLLVRRKKAPNVGFWGFPGGVQELGETLIEAAIRELDEETGVRAVDPAVFTAFDAIDRDDDGKIRYHYTLVVVWLRWHSGEGSASDDADDLGWFSLEDLESLPALPSVAQMVVQVLEAERE